MLRRISNRFLTLKPWQIYFTSNVTKQNIPARLNIKFSTMSVKLDTIGDSLGSNFHDHVDNHFLPNDLKKKWTDKDSIVYSNLQFNEYQQVHEILNRLKNIKGLTEFKMRFENILSEFLVQSPLMDKFISNRQNWSILFDNMSTEDFPTQMKTNDFDFVFANIILKCILETQVQSKSESGLPYYYLALADSFNNFFLFKKFSIQSN